MNAGVKNVLVNERNQEGNVERLIGGAGGGGGGIKYLGASERCRDSTYAYYITLSATL